MLWKGVQKGSVGKGVWGEVSERRGHVPGGKCYIRSMWTEDVCGGRKCMGEGSI